jgi:hypothetical protein
MRFRPRLVGLALAGLWALALASCGGSSKTTSSAAGTTSNTSTQPAFAQSVVLRRLSGTVLIKLPAAAGFVHLQGALRVRLGTVIDARAGLVRLTAASPTPGKLSVGEFHEGEFEVLQSSAGNGVVDLVVHDTKSERTTCTGASGSRKQTTSLLGLLLGTGHGHFRTRGELAAASVSGTDWGVRNRCDGTLTVVRSGTVVVTDFRLHKNITLHAGQTYLAKAA